MGHLLQDPVPDFKALRGSCAPWFVENIPPFTATRFDPSKHGNLDVVFLTVNSEEFKATVHRFCVKPNNSESTHDLHLEKANVGSLTVYFGSFGADNLRIGVVGHKMGAEGQQRTVEKVLPMLNPRVIVSIGVGWGNPNLLAQEKPAYFGDVMVSETLVEFGKNTRVDSAKSFYSRCEQPLAGTELIRNRFMEASRTGQWKFER